MKLDLKYTCVLIAISFCSCIHSLDCEKIRTDYISISNNLNSKDDSLHLLHELNNLISSDSSCMKAYQYRATLNFYFENYSNAKKDFKKTIESDSLNVYSNYYLGVIANLEDSNYNAIRYLANAKRYKEKDGVIVNTNNDFADKFDIKYEEILFYLGSILFEINEMQAAKEIFLYTERRNYFNPEGYNYLVRIYLMENAIDSACLYYNRFLQNGDKSDTVLFCK